MFGVMILATLTGSVFSLAGGLLLLWKGHKLAERLSHLLISFAVGVLLSVAMLDLLPEAIEHVDGEVHQVFEFALLGIVSFFLLERFLVWFHHHHAPHGATPTVLLLNLGDTLHNFIDGVAIGATFLVEPALGISTAVAVALHEIPQEISDFAVMLSSKMKKNYIVLVNLLSAVASIVGAVGAYFIGQRITGHLPYLVAFAAGMFLYIACSDLLPTLHAKFTKRDAILQTVLVALGVCSTMLLGTFLEH